MFKLGKDPLWWKSSFYYCLYVYMWRFLYTLRQTMYKFKSQHHCRVFFPCSLDHINPVSVQGRP